MCIRDSLNIPSCILFFLCIRSRKSLFCIPEIPSRSSNSAQTRHQAPEPQMIFSFSLPWFLVCPILFGGHQWCSFPHPRTLFLQPACILRNGSWKQHKGWPGAWDMLTTGPCSNISLPQPFSFFCQFFKSWWKKKPFLLCAEEGQWGWCPTSGVFNNYTPEKRNTRTSLR